MDGRIEAHNRRPASIWSSGGDTYNEISHQIASAIDHCVQRIDPKPGERVLDVATGTGWASRLLARRGACVTGVDIAPELIVSAEIRAEQEGLDIVYDLGDAERLPYPDGHFDAVISTFGVMFASRPDVAASELARVCRRGGRVGLTTWLPDSNVFNMFAVMREYMPAPPAPAPPSPFAWGRRERVLDLLGYHFDVRFEEGITIYYDRDGQSAWDVFSNGYGPTKALACALDTEQKERFRHDFIAFHDRFRTDVGIAVPRAYLLSLGRRR